jgi:hypothetical protein
LLQPKAKVLQAKAKVAFDRLRAKVAMHSKKQRLTIIFACASVASPLASLLLVNGYEKRLND